MKVKSVTKTLAEQARLDPERRSLIGVASTGLADRDGDVLEPGGWELANYLANPVVLWDHDASLPPVAKASRVWVEDGRLLFEAQFAGPEENPFADQVFRLYLGGLLKGFSVRFAGLAARPRLDENGRAVGRHYQRQELLEISCVTVGANPEALVMTAKALGASAENLERLQGDDAMKGLLERLRKALGLAAEADEEQVAKSVETLAGEHGTVLKGLRDLAGLGDQATPAAALEAVKGLKPGQAAALPAALAAELGLAVSAGEGEALGAIKGLKAAKAQAEGLAGQVASLTEWQHEREAEELVAKGLAEGKITPAQKEWAKGYAKGDAKGFGAYLAAAPRVVPVGVDLPGAPARSAAADELDDAQRAVNKALGVSDETWKKHFPGTAK